MVSFPEKFIKALEGMHNFDIGIGKQLSFDTLNHQGLKGVYYLSITENGSFVMVDS
ncbi:MAG: hypothetical protein KKC39_00355 [Candidatus Omnitrophica bacterium]|nr:hypothetical protein [Candidatus Omnitrophota bacterium]MBU4419248.1 hypothetical protein [Candidatus Omnitrophota bacterium]MBU4467183.1 hypothetical protein [Candidatus Omnitrophota bacterium]MCG2707195.1 hypothetical protein [Candidatus Omnitrophota bacterium]